MPNRPLGVVLIALYSALGALLCLLVSFLAMGGAVLVPRMAAGWMGLLSTALLGSAHAALPAAGFERACPL
jgi:hypothetical protein